MNQALGFSSFSPSPPPADEIAVAQKRSDIFQAAMKRIAAENNLIKAHSDYRGMDTFFIHQKTRAVYKVNNTESSKSLTPTFIRPPYDEIEHILQLNGYQ